MVFEPSFELGRIIFHIDNGDNLFDGFQPGIRVICDGFLSGNRLIAPSEGAKVLVTGISSLVLTGSGYARAIRPRYQAEIEVVIPD